MKKSKEKRRGLMLVDNTDGEYGPDVMSRCRSGESDHIVYRMTHKI